MILVRRNNRDMYGPRHDLELPNHIDWTEGWPTSWFNPSIDDWLPLWRIKMIAKRWSDD